MSADGGTPRQVTDGDNGFTSPSRLSNNTLVVNGNDLHPAILVSLMRFDSDSVGNGMTGQVLAPRLVHCPSSGTRCRRHALADRVEEGGWSIDARVSTRPDG